MPLRLFDGWLSDTGIGRSPRAFWIIFTGSMEIRQCSQGAVSLLRTLRSVVM